MLAVGRFISRGVYTVSGPFQPFGGAIDIIVVEQPDGSFKSSPWYVKFGKFQGVLKSREKVVDICVNDVDVDLHMFLDHKGEAFFLREVDVEEGESVVVQSLSSGEDTDEQSRGARRPTKLHTNNFDSKNSCSVDQDNLSSTTKVLARNGSRRTRFLGYVFGKRSMKERNFQEIDAGSEVARTDSLERAEIAADLLEVNWSTSLAINKPKKGKISRFSSVDVLNDDAFTNLQIDGKESCISSFPRDVDDNNLTQCILDFDEMTGSCDPPLHESGLEGTNAEMSHNSISIPAEDMDYSSGSSCVEEHCDTVSESLHELQPGNTHSKVKERNTLYQISSSESCVSDSSELGMSSSKQFRDAHDYDENDVRLVGDKASGKENKGDQMCRETSGKSDCEQMHNDLYLSRGESKGVPVQDETLSVVTEQLSETNHLREHGVVVSKDSSDGRGYTRESYNWISEENRVACLSNNKSNAFDKLLSSIEIPFLTTSAGMVGSEILHPHVSLMDHHSHGDKIMQLESEVFCCFSDQRILNGFCQSEDDGGKPEGTPLLDECFIQPVGPDPLLVMVEDSGLDNTCTVPAVSISTLQIQDNNTQDEERLGETIYFQEKGLASSDISEEEQFLISDLSDFKRVEGSQGIESVACNIEHKDGLSSLATDSSAVVETLNADNESYSSSDKLNFLNISNEVNQFPEELCQKSSPIDIRRSERIANENNERRVESLPNMRAYIDNLESHDLHHPCHSLDSNAPSPKWLTSRSETDVVEELQIENGRPTSKEAEICEQKNNELIIPESGDPSEATISTGWWPFYRKRSGSMKGVRLASVGSRSCDANFPVEITSAISGDRAELNPEVVKTKKKIKALTPTSKQLASLNLKTGRNIVTFTFSTAIVGKQQVDARIYLWKWNTRIVISDVDGTITRSDVLGQFMPMVGVDWSHIGVAHLFSAIKENGYDLLFLSARAISQAYLTRQFLLNLKQDGKTLPDGPVVISPDGLFPSLYREVIRRAPHEFKIACLETIRELFPPDSNPFYAGFGNRDTDEISYLRVGIPKGKIFTINPKGEVAVLRRVDTKSYTSLHALVNGIFPPMNTTEQEDFNAWNFWKLPLPSLDI